MHDAMEDAKNSGIDITRYIQSLRPATITSLWRQPYSDAYCYGSKARKVVKDNGISINAAGSTEWFFLLKDIFRIFCDVYTSIIGRPSPSAHQSFTSLIIIYILSPNWTKIQSMLLKLTHLCVKPVTHISLRPKVSSLKLWQAFTAQNASSLWAQIFFLPEGFEGFERSER